MCKKHKETTEHILLDCKKYKTQQTELNKNITQILPNLTKTKTDINLLLTGRNKYYKYNKLQTRIKVIKETLKYINTLNIKI